MKNATSVFFALAILLIVSLSCSFLKEKATKTVAGTPAIDLTTPQKGIDAKVELDKTQTASAKIGDQGGSVSLTGSDGSKFVLDIPADAIATDTMITMTAVKSIEGSPLENSTPIAVQLEPSGLAFKQIVTLTITPSKEIPIKNQIIFGYEGNGKDYHLAPVDPKSKEIKVKLLRFSGAGVGSVSDAAWAAHLMIQANEASTRILQKFGEVTQAERHKMLLGDESGSSSEELFKPFVEAFMDQVVLKEIAAAELECKHAQKALNDLIFIERTRQLAGLADSATGSTGFREKSERLLEIGKKCAGSYHIVGGLDDFQTNTKVCDIMKPFTLTSGGITNKFSGGLSGTYNFTGPFQMQGSGTYTISLPDGPGKPGTMTGQGSGTVMGRYSRSGTEKYTLTPIPPCSE